MQITHAVAVLALLVAGACGSQSTTPAAVADDVRLAADNVIYDLDQTITKDGIRAGDLRGDTAYFYEADRRFDLIGVELRFYSETGAQTGTLTSETAEYDIGHGSFIARGNVLLVTETPEGTRRLQTPELHYEPEADRLWSDSSFVLVQDGRTTEGTSFQSDSQFRTWTVTEARTVGGVPIDGPETTQVPETTGEPVTVPGRETDRGPETIIR